VLEFTTRYFHLLDQKAHDDTHGGYHEFFSADWTPSSEAPYVGGAPGMKLMKSYR